MILINGQQQEHISARDRGLHYGDGLFETIAVNEGRALAWDRHIARLQSGCYRLGIECPDSRLLQHEAALVCVAGGRHVLKLIISRGQGGRGYGPPRDDSQTTRILSLYDWPEYPSEFEREGIEAAVCDMRLGCNPALAGLKHLNRLEQVLLRKELSTSGLAEAIVLDVNDNVIEGSMSNVFLVQGGTLSTPDLGASGVEGVIRGAILELAGSIGLECEIRSHSLDEVFQADEVFFCNSIAGIWPVSRICQKNYKKGPLTGQLQQLLADHNLIIPR